MYGAIIVGGFVAGLCVFAIAHRKALAKINPVHAGEAAGCGVGVVAGIHLIFCAWWPLLLVHHHEKDGTHYDLPAHVECEMGELHKLHIAIGGVVTAAASAVGLQKICKR